LKHKYSPDLVASYRRELFGTGARGAAFEEQVLAQLESLELKGRVSLIADALNSQLPGDYSERVERMVAILAPERPWRDGDADGTDGWRGMKVWPLVSVVERHGLEERDISFAAMKELTKRFTAEFAVRQFLVDDLEDGLARMLEFTKDSSDHLRRFASEGTRPRLPWGLRLKAVVADPTVTLPILEALKDDPTEYVRRSVANHLNDIAKDHPDYVVEICDRWSVGASKGRLKLIRHALRSLVKSGHIGALEVLGYSSAPKATAALVMGSDLAQVGGFLPFEVALQSGADAVEPLIVDYVVHLVRANGSRTPKVFKMKTFELAAGKWVTLTKRHSFKPVTTRRYYAGAHRIEVMVNGKVVAGAEFTLVE
jgi:3-methyladenine DNA glycosylase AlkC